MLGDFLSHSHTDALSDKNFKEWHMGIPYYGFWAIMIERPEQLSLISKVQSHLQHFFLPGYSRQAHITLNACGLMSERHFSKADLDKQVSMIEKMNLSPFEVSISHIDSFTTAAYLNISDTSGSLSKINEALKQISCDSEPTSFKPHITLGLYRERFESKKVAKKIIEFGFSEAKPLLLSEVQFCRYGTANIQGPIDLVKRIRL